jgi:hypothetical protein
MWGRAAFFLLGVTAGPIIRSVVRVTARELIKTTFVAGREARRFAAQIREEIQDVTAEARAQVPQSPSVS